MPTSENLAESGVNVVVGLRKGSAHWEKASEFAATHPNFKVMEVEEAAKAGDVVMMPVSYTHLRAHETDSYLVCRLLLEKKKKKTKKLYNV